MKIKHRALSYDKVLALPPEPHEKPLRPSRVVRTLLRTLSVGELRDVGFTFDAEGMERLGKDQPALFLMNHSSFIDLKIASVMLYPRPFNIICTSDGFVGKKQLMRHLGCIPTRKFIPDVTLVKDMVYAVKELGNSLLMYWYELGDMICIGNSKALYYCFPKEGGDVVAKTRLAAEEYYRLRFPAKHEKDS
ncbi:MAG: 1-acyl-sn-glycerol-3-phosphate acyltransferase [Clostridia bacterium]|nr:1-acyl-sn-glycerol-3-phosphate acyltransferase [Clostridia bacterium]MBQ5544064.1 1-acyl-sn-glycerol-3-phosphate acyltransferase [Clostridia bacterium]